MEVTGSELILYIFCKVEPTRFEFDVWHERELDFVGQTWGTLQCVRRDLRLSLKAE